MSYAKSVDDLVIACLFGDSEVVDGKPPDGALMVKGIVRTFGFHKGRVEGSKEALRVLARSIVKDSFLKGGGGGFSFLGLPETRDGVQWCEHNIAEAFFCLCKAAGLADYCISRKYWSSLPGGMPYVVFDLDAHD